MDIILWLLIIFGIPGLIAFFLTEKPEAVVRLYVRTYGGMIRTTLTANEITKAGNRTYLGLPRASLEDFLDRGADYPQEFPRAIDYVQNLGRTIWVAIAVIAALLIFTAFFGRLEIVR